MKGLFIPISKTDELMNFKCSRTVPKTTSTNHIRRHCIFKSNIEKIMNYEKPLVFSICSECFALFSEQLQNCFIEVIVTSDFESRITCLSDLFGTVLQYTIIKNPSVLVII